MTTVYEQPLNERMRALLRLEHLFELAEHQLMQADAWSSRAALEAIIDIVALVGRIDLKSELIKELERQVSALEAYQPHPQVDSERLESVLRDVRETLGGLRAVEQPFGHELRSNELLNVVRQRNSIPAGTCDFDLPTYRFWLKQAPEQRARDLTRWLAAFALVRRAVSLSLNLIRGSGSSTRETAWNGFFQKTLDTSHPCLLVRVEVPDDIPCYTEISAGKHRFTVRFMQQPDAESRPTQTEDNVEFDLACCGI